jgi:hypothetical protein
MAFIFEKYKKNGIKRECRSVSHENEEDEASVKTSSHLRSKARLQDQRPSLAAFKIQQGSGSKRIPGSAPSKAAPFQTYQSNRIE